jgi:hypothetical protein
MYSRATATAAVRLSAFFRAATSCCWNFDYWVRSMLGCSGSCSIGGRSRVRRNSASRKLLPDAADSLVEQSAALFS